MAVCSWDGSCGGLSRHTAPTYAHAPDLGRVGGGAGEAAGFVQSE